MIKFDDSTPVLDMTVINQLRSIDPEGKRGLLKRLVEMYINTAESIVTEIRQDLTKDDSEHLLYLAHRFKTTNANLGLKRMHTLLSRLESEGTSSDDKLLIVQQLEVEVVHALDALRAL